MPGTLLEHDFSSRVYAQMQPTAFSLYSLQAKKDLEYNPTDLKTSITDMAYSLIDAGFVKKTRIYQNR